LGSSSLGWKGDHLWILEDDEKPRRADKSKMDREEYSGTLGIQRLRISPISFCIFDNSSNKVFIVF